jgi:hypothetical protein
MAKNTVRRWVTAIFDLVAAKKVERQFDESLATAGKKGGQSFVRELRSAFDKRMADLKVALAKGLIDPKQFKTQADLAAKQFNSGIIKGMETARAAGNLTNAEYLKLSRALKKTGDEGSGAWDRIKAGIVRAGAALAAAFGIRAGIRFGVESIREFLGSERIWTELAGTVNAAGESFEGLEQRVRAAAAAFQNATIHTDEDYARSLQRLIAITGRVEASIRNMNLVADIAARFFGGDLVKATDAVAKGMTTGAVTINRMKFSLDELAKRSIGAAAEQTFTLAGKLQQLNNQWGEFKEQIGGVLVGGRDTVGVLTLVTDAVKSMVRWVGDNREALQRWVSEGVNAGITALRTILGLARDWLQLQGKLSFTVGTAPAPLADTEKGLKAQIEGFRKQRAQLEKEQAAALAALEKAQKGLTLFGMSSPRILSLGQDLASVNDQLDRVDDNAARAAAALAALGEKPTAGPDTSFVDPEIAKRRAKELADELIRIQTETAVQRLRLEQNLTEAMAREEVRRQQVKTGRPVRESVTVAEVEAAQRALDNLSVVATVFDETITPAIARTDHKLMDLRTGMEKFPSARLARNFVSPWTKALNTIHHQVNSELGIFHELGQAWAEGGFAGLAALAAHKVKENLASAIEMAARAFGSFALGNPASAGLYLKSAAQHGAAAAAWSVLGGGGGGGSGSTAGGVAGDTGPNLSQGESFQQPGSEIHVHFVGPKAFSPEMRKVVVGNLIQGEEIYGKNPKVHYHRDN